MSNFEQIVQRAGIRPPQKSIERISESDFVSGFKQIAAAGNPVIFSTSSGMTSVQELKNAIGDFPLKLRNRTFDSAGKYDPRNRSYTESTVADFVDQIESGSADSYAGNVMFDGDAENVFEIAFPDVVPKASLRKPSIWLGPKDSVTPLHRDSADNFAFHIFGAKRWTLYPPEQHQLLGIMSLEGLQQTGGEFAISELDIENPDLDRFPEFANAEPIQVDLNASNTREGEVLFLPAGWHHHVRTLETSLMLNYWVEDSNFSPGFLK